MRDGGALLGQISYRSVPIGAMGYTTGIVTAPDESWQLVKTDGSGCWRRDGATGAWTQCIRRDNTSAAVFDIDPTFGESDGAWEAEIAPNGTTALVSFRHRWLKSTDSGATWSLRTGISEAQMNSNAQHDGSAYQRLAFGKAVFDATNSDVFYWCAEGGTPQRSLDGMATSSAVTGIPTPVSPYSRAADDDRYCLFAVDDTSALTSGRHSIVYAASIGNGIYKSTDGGGSFSQIHATLLYPANIQCIDGVLWVFDYRSTGGTEVAAPNIYKYDGSSWSGPLGTSANAIRFVAQDLTTSTTFFGGRFLMRSTNSGANWANPDSGSGSNMEAIPHDAPLMAGVFNDGKNLINARISAHSNGRFYLSTGYGVMYIERSNWLAATNPTTKLQLHEDTAGIENIVPQDAIYTPLGDAFMVSQDKAIIKVRRDGSFPEESYPPSTLTNGYAIDYAGQDPSYLAAQITKNGIRAAYSEDSGASWQPFPVTGTTKTGGGICVVDVGKVIIAPGADGWPVVTHDGGQTWADCVFDGFAKIISGTTGWGFGTIETDRFIICNDKDNPLNVYAYNYGVSGVNPSEGIWKSTDGGLNFTKVSTATVLPALTGFHNRLRYQGGFLWLNQYYPSPYNQEHANVNLWRSADEGATFQKVPGLEMIYYYAFGKALPVETGGGDYPALWAHGWVNSVKGLHRCDNADAATIGDMTWTTVEVSPAFSRPTALAADPTRYGRTLTGRGGQSYEEAYYDYTMRLS